MVTKIEIKDKHGWVLFTYECENNNIKKTIEEAVRQGESLIFADLSNLDLSHTNLTGADLTYAILYNTNLSYANLEGADLNGADFGNTNLHKANLKNADLSDASLSNSNLRRANLYDAILDGAFLGHCVFSYTKINYPMSLPDGEFIGWSKIWQYRNKKRTPYIVKLKILADSKRSRGTTDECRCDKALVMEIQDLDSNKLDMAEIIDNEYTPLRLSYKVGEIVHALKWYKNRFKESPYEIYFFLDREKAVND